MGIRLEHTTDGVRSVCTECGEEIKSILHRCNPFKDVDLDAHFPPKKSEVKDGKL